MKAFPKSIDKPSPAGKFFCNCNRPGIGKLLQRALFALGLSSLPLLAATNIEDKAFEFGPGTSFSRSNFRTLSVPARTVVSVSGSFTTGISNEKVFIDLLAPSAASIGSTGPDGPLIETLGGSSGIVPSGSFNFTTARSSEFGCPSTWRVRVRSAVANPKAKVSGIIRFSSTIPLRQNLRIQPNITEGTITSGPRGAFSILADSTSADRNIVVATAIRPGFVDGTGAFQIKAKWHTDTIALGSFTKLTVELRRPNGTLAASQTGYSQHAPSNLTPKINISYIVSAADAVLPGDWKIRVANNTRDKVVRFNIDNTQDGNFDDLVPEFNSTFFANCSGKSGLDPTKQETQANDPFVYNFKWTVPEPMNWHDLRWLQLRIRDGGKTILWINFSEEKQAFSVFNEKKGEFGEALLAGESGRLETNDATLHLAGTRVTAASAKSRTVNLRLPISVRPGTAGRTYTVEVAAQDDDMEKSPFPDFFSPAGKLTVLPPP